MPFKEMNAKEMSVNPFAMLHDEWALVSAGTAESYNTMTVSWGMMGTMWNKSVVMVFIRPQRYTKEFIDREGLFTLSFYPQEYKKALGLLGSKSGRDSDKIRESGLTPYFTHNTVAFEEAYTFFVCRKLFGDQPLDATKFIERNLQPAFYPDKDFHHMYFGEVVKVFVKE